VALKKEKVPGEKLFKKLKTSDLKSAENTLSAQGQNDDSSLPF
jgi:hypothetical protein